MLFRLWCVCSWIEFQPTRVKIFCIHEVLHVPKTAVLFFYTLNSWFLAFRVGVVCHPHIRDAVWLSRWSAFKDLSWRSVICEDILPIGCRTPWLPPYLDSGLHAGRCQSPCRAWPWCCYGSSCMPSRRNGFWKLGAMHVSSGLASWPCRAVRHFCQLNHGT